jgi:prevent-host-death family protein
MSEPWSVSEAKARLSEVLRRAREGAPQRIGVRDACIVVSEADWRELQGRELGAWLVNSAPRGEPLPTPSRKSRRTVPFEGDEEDR